MGRTCTKNNKKRTRHKKKGGGGQRRGKISGKCQPVVREGVSQALLIGRERVDPGRPLVVKDKGQLQGVIVSQHPVIVPVVQDLGKIRVNMAAWK